MQKQARITSKGQITVPHEIRKLLGVQPGDGLVFESDGTRTQVRPVRASSPFEKYRGIGNGGIGNGKAGSGRKAVVQAIRELRGR
jgi:AbrB family looped-hinge helix DNA binding protein